MPALPRFVPAAVPAPLALRRRWRRVYAWTLGSAALALAAASPLRAQPTGLGGRADTARAVAAPDTASGARSFGPSPRRTLTRALVAPGWGQLTNRQPAKAAVVWGALAGTAGAAVFVHGRYREAGRAYLYRVCTDAPATCRIDAATAAGYADDYARRYDGLTAASVRQTRDGLRRNRDLLVLGIGLVYVLQAADAYVGAHLRYFDEDERLSLHLTPAPEGPRLALRLRVP